MNNIFCLGKKISKPNYCLNFLRNFPRDYVTHFLSQDITMLFHIMMLFHFILYSFTQCLYTCYMGMWYVLCSMIRMTFDRLLNMSILVWEDGLWLISRHAFYIRVGGWFYTPPCTRGYYFSGLKNVTHSLYPSICSAIFCVFKQ